jgi:hypothetical protein
MAEVRKNVRSVQIDHVCEECGKGKMRVIANLMSNPIQFKHGCNLARRTGCTYEITLSKRLPYVDYVEVDDFGDDVV